MVVGRGLARMRDAGREDDRTGRSPVDVRLTPWTSAGVDSDPATHFTLPRGELIGSDQGFRDAWELVRAEDPPRLRRLEDALLHVVALQARGEKGTQGVQATIPGEWISRI